MPNGGTDNCGSCGFNESNQGKWGHPVYPIPKTGYCTIRGVHITNPLWTYCLNYKTKNGEPDGPIYTSGIYEGYCRIPWDSSHEPQFSTSGICTICSRPIEKGIVVDTDNSGRVYFCCNGHYLKWWKKKHQGQILVWDYSWDQ